MCFLILWLACLCCCRGVAAAGVLIIWLTWFHCCGGSLNQPTTNHQQQTTGNNATRGLIVDERPAERAHVSGRAYHLRGTRAVLSGRVRVNGKLRTAFGFSEACLVKHWLDASLQRASDPGWQLQWPQLPSEQVMCAEEFGLLRVIFVFVGHLWPGSVT